MKKLMKLWVIVLGIGLLFSACKEKSEEEKMLNDIEKYVSALEKGDNASADKYDDEFDEKYNIGLGDLHLMYDLEGEDFLTEFTSGDAALKSRARQVFRRWKQAYEKMYGE